MHSTVTGRYANGIAKDVTSMVSPRAWKKKGDNSIGITIANAVLTPPAKMINVGADLLSRDLFFTTVRRHMIAIATKNASVAYIPLVGQSFRPDIEAT